MVEVIFNESKWEGEDKEKYNEVLGGMKSIFKALRRKLAGIIDDEDTAWKEIVKIRNNKKGKLYEVNLEVWRNNFSLPPSGWMENYMGSSEILSHEYLRGRRVQSFQYWVPETSVPDIFRGIIDPCD